MEIFFLISENRLVVKMNHPIIKYDGV